MDQRPNCKVEAAVRACRQACLGTMTPLTNYWITIELLSEDPTWSRSEINELCRRFVESMIDDATNPPASRLSKN